MLSSTALPFGRSKNQDLARGFSLFDAAKIHCFRELCKRLREIRYLLIYLGQEYDGIVIFSSQIESQ